MKAQYQPLENGQVKLWPVCSLSQSSAGQFASLFLLAVQFDNYPGPGKKWRRHLLHQEVTLHFSLVSFPCGFYSLAHAYSAQCHSVSSSCFICGFFHINTWCLLSTLTWPPLFYFSQLLWLKTFPLLFSHYPPSLLLSPSLSLTALPPWHPLTPPPSPSVPLCSHGPCMWHEAEPKHPGCPLQPFAVPDLVKF